MELKNLKKVHSPKDVVTLLDGECPRDLSGREWMVMPMAHATLLDILENKQAKKNSTWIREYVCSAIKFLPKTHNLVHNDIKPDNILRYDNPPRAVLTDFGLSEDVGTICHNHAEPNKQFWCGVCLYYSTQKLLEALVHPNWDWFALTVVFYEMFLNYEGSSYHALITTGQVDPSGSPSEVTVQAWDNEYSHDTTGHYVAVTKLSVFAKPVDAKPPAPALWEKMST